MWKRKKRPYRAGCRHRGKTVDAIRQKHPLTIYVDKICSCFAISDGLLPTNLVGHVCSVQLADRVEQPGISPGSYRHRRPARKRPLAVAASRAGMSPSISPTIPPPISPTDRGPGSFTLSALRLMTLCDLSQISAVQHNYGISYSNLIKTDTGPFIQEFLKHFKVMFLNAQSVRNKTLDICDYV